MPKVEKVFDLADSLRYETCNLVDSALDSEVDDLFEGVDLGIVFAVSEDSLLVIEELLCAENLRLICSMASLAHLYVLFQRFVPWNIARSLSEVLRYDVVLCIWLRKCLES